MQRSFPRALFSCLGWLLSLVILVGLSACGPAPSDPVPSVESHASLSGASASHPAPQDSRLSRNDPTKPATGLVPLASPHASVSERNIDLALMPDQKEARVPRSDRSRISDPTNPSVDASEPPGVLPIMNVWTQEGTPVSVVIPEEPTDDASIEADANTERRNWDIAHETERMEDDNEPAERFSEKKE